MVLSMIVAHDPLGELKEGTVISEPVQLHKLQRRGVVLLPVDLDTVHDAVGSYFKRSWGEGWTYDGMSGHRGCPMILGVQPNRPFVYWVVAAQKLNENACGTIKLTGDTSKQNTLSGGMSPEHPATAIRDVKAEVGKTFYLWGRNKLNVSSSGLFGLSVYGVASGLLVLWSACSQAHDRVDLEL